MGRHSAIRLAGVMGAGLLSACAPAIRSQRDEAVPVPQGATWAWAAVEAAPPAGEHSDSGPPSARGRRDERRPASDPTAARAIPRQRFHRALEAAMAAKGFRRVEPASDPEFLLTLAIEGPSRPGPGGAVSVGMVGVWGGRGPYRRWVAVAPWGGWWWQPWGLGWYAMPYWGPAVPYQFLPAAQRRATVVAILRRRAGGEVAWRAQYRADTYDLAYLTQHRAQRIADRLVATLR